MATLKTKGDTAELMVAADLAGRGYRVAFPYGEDCDCDLILDRGNALERVQVKYTRSNGGVVTVRCSSHSLTEGKIRATKAVHRSDGRVDCGVRRDLRLLLLRVVERARGRQA